MKRLLLIVLFLSAMLSLVSTATEADLYQSWHSRCLGGDLEIIDQQMRKFEERIAKDSSDDLARAYLGSAHTLKAKYTTWPGTKLSNLKRGKQLLNSAVNRSPENLRVRMVRAIACYKVPKRFKVREIAVKDFQKIIEPAKKGSGLSEGERQVILYYAYLTWQEEKLKGAESLKQACLSINQSSKYAKLLK